MSLVRTLRAVARRGPRSGCGKDTKHCDFWNWGADYLRPECCTRHMKELLFFTADLLAERGIAYWLDFGTLLGAVRDEEFIPWDGDLDFGVLARDLDAIPALEREVAAAGFHLDRSDPSGVPRVCYSDVNWQHVDLLPWAQDGDVLRTEDPEYDWPGVSNAAKTAFPSSYLEAPESVRLYGRAFPAPSPVHDFLRKHRYGPSYLEPARPVLTVRLPDLGGEDVTPATDALLERLRASDRRLAELKAASALSGSYVWRNWLDAGLPEPPSPRYVERAIAAVPEGERTPTAHRLAAVIGSLEQAIDELERPSPHTRLRRAGRRLGRLARIAAARSPLAEGAVRRAEG